MKTLFVEARRKTGAIGFGALDKIPKEIDSIGILASVQYSSFLPLIKKNLKGRKVFVGGKVIGCDVSNAKKLLKKVKAFLFIGSGKFHALQLALLGKTVFVFNPESSMLDKIMEGDVEKIKAGKKAALIKLLNSKKIGIIVSIKPGQQQLEKALSSKKKFEKKGREVFIFLCNNIDEKELENFSCDAWLNTACQALNMEPQILNIEDERI